MRIIKAVLAAAAAAALAVLAVARFLPLPPGTPVPAEKTVRPPPSQPPGTLPSEVPGIPDLPALAGRLGAGTIPPTPAQIEEERRVEREQVADAARSLRSPEVSERIGAAEQLAAYPTLEAERRLAAALAEDAAPSVREAAALSLAYVKAPESKTIHTLVHALRDISSAVRTAALQTLEGYLNGMDAASAGFLRIRKGLGGLLKSGKLDKETERGVRELLADTEG